MQQRTLEARLQTHFFDNDELPGRDLFGIPHLRLIDSIRRLSSLTESEQAKLRFFHINHTNQARFEHSKARLLMNAKGFELTRRNERVCPD